MGLLFVFCSHALWAEEREELTISVGDWPPFFVEGEPGQGKVARLVRDVFAEQGYDVTFHFLPWKRAYREAATGRHDATAIWMFAEDREKDFRYSNAVMREKFVLFHRKGTDIQWESIEDLAGLTLGASIGYSYGPDFDRAARQEKITVEQAASTELNFRKLFYGRIDAFPEEISVGYYILRRETAQPEAEEITHHPRPLLENESFLLFPRNDPEAEKHLHAFNRGLQHFRESGRYADYFSAQPQASLE
jgi:polar amino acid transport system substrate-binding protein